MLTYTYFSICGATYCKKFVLLCSKHNWCSGQRVGAWSATLQLAIVEGVAIAHIFESQLADEIEASGPLTLLLIEHSITERTEIVQKVQVGAVSAFAYYRRAGNDPTHPPSVES